jgi:hypothetical protein
MKSDKQMHKVVALVRWDGGNVDEESERDRKRKGRVEEDGMQKAAGYWDVDAGVEACKSICRMGTSVLYRLDGLVHRRS